MRPIAIGPEQPTRFFKMRRNRHDAMARAIQNQPQEGMFVAFVQPAGGNYVEPEEPPAGGPKKRPTH